MSRENNRSEYDANRFLGGAHERKLAPIPVTYVEQKPCKRKRRFTQRVEHTARSVFDDNKDSPAIPVVLALVAISTILIAAAKIMEVYGG